MFRDSRCSMILVKFSDKLSRAWLGGDSAARRQPSSSPAAAQQQPSSSQTSSSQQAAKQQRSRSLAAQAGSRQGEQGAVKEQPRSSQGAAKEQPTSSPAGGCRSSPAANQHQPTRGSQGAAKERKEQGAAKQQQAKRQGMVVGMLQSMDVLSPAKNSTDGRHAAKHALVKAFACTNSTTFVLCSTASVLGSTSAKFSAPTKVVTSWKHVTSN